jgi:hypothetical protein
MVGNLHIGTKEDIFFKKKRCGVLEKLDRCVGSFPVDLGFSDELIGISHHPLQGGLALSPAYARIGVPAGEI